MDLQCLLTERAAVGLVMDHAPRVRRGGAGADDRDSWLRSAPWPIVADAAADVPFSSLMTNVLGTRTEEEMMSIDPLVLMIARAELGEQRQWAEQEGPRRAAVRARRHVSVETAARLSVPAVFRVAAVRLWARVRNRGACAANS